ncbi:cupin domain-containing protein [Pseudohongiella sp. O18]|uniref:cupin domain-containing protein n=1 Tax=Pseudohongiella sp. O18 TaxID=2904248 RepID=UPI001F1E56B7|nr:cupin [Pseudohongiella sp. O18]
MKLPLNLLKDFVVMSPNKAATVERFDPGLYERLDKTYGSFEGHDLISCHEFDVDWPSWEMHPHGDEIVVLLAGSTTFHLQAEDGDKTIELSEPGQYVIVPKGIWHTAKTPEFSRVLFITPGQETQNRAL